MGISRQELLTNAVQEAAKETTQWWNGAAGDMGYYFEPIGYDADSKAMVAFESFKESCDKLEYAKEAMADWFYGDVDTIIDCCGDHIYDHASMIRTNPAGFAKDVDQDVIFIMICEEIKANTHMNAMKGAMTRMIVEHRKYLKKKKAS